jgi:hypothetical protein
VLTTEELRVAALSASAKRGKWVARRRIFWRWSTWISWAYVLPSIGFIVVLASLIGFAFWQYMGHDAAYVAAQKWVQQELGSFTVNAIPQTGQSGQSGQNVQSRQSAQSRQSEQSKVTAAIEKTQKSELVDISYNANTTKLQLDTQLSTLKTKSESEKP